MPKLTMKEYNELMSKVKFMGPADNSTEPLVWDHTGKIVSGGDEHTHNEPDHEESILRLGKTIQELEARITALENA